MTFKFLFKKNKIKKCYETILYSSFKIRANTEHKKKLAETAGVVDYLVNGFGL